MTVATARLFAALLAGVLAAAAAPAASAVERILAIDIEVDVGADGRLDVTERITVRAEGRQVRRGITRSFPTRYRDGHGNRVVVDFDVVEVLRDDAPEPWFIETQSNGVVLNTGDDRFLPVPATYTWTLRYRTDRQLGFFEAHDELYWNAIGTDTIFPVESARVVVRLPGPVPVSALRAEGYTGPQGSRGSAFVASLPAPGTARWTLASPLPPGHGLTIVLAFPKGVVAEPTRMQALGRLLRDNLGVLVVLATLLAVLAWCVREWRRVGRDPARGVVIAQYEPPAGHTPGGLRHVLRMRYDNRCFSADLLALAVDGHLRIEQDGAEKPDGWALVRRPGSGALEPWQRALLDRLFRDGDRLVLDNAHATTLMAARHEHASALARRYEPAMFRRNGRSIAIATAIAAIGAVAAFAASGGNGLPLVVAGTVLLVATLVVFGVLVKAPTPEGRAFMDRIEGLQLYLGVAERAELAGLRGPAEPALDAGRYEALLPYAVALEVEDAWTGRFTRAVGVEAAEEATRQLAWYRGARMAGIGQLADTVGRALDTTIAAAATPPGSSSGGGGGGFSGGGGGGGGVGGR